MATYTDFDAQVVRELEDTSSGGTYSADSRLAWTNEAILEIAKRCETMEEQTYTTSVVGQQTYDLPDYTLEIKKFVYGDDSLPRVPISSWPEIVASGTPTQWDVVNRAIYLYPVPTTAATVTIFRRRSPAEIATTSATTPMPFESRHNALIKNYVKAQAAMQSSDLNTYNLLMQAYEAGIANAWTQERQEEYTLDAGTPLEVW